MIVAPTFAWGIEDVLTLVDAASTAAMISLVHQVEYAALIPPNLLHFSQVNTE